jgi:UDP-glucose 4-epimerase
VKILITGGNGFIGAWTMLRLVRAQFDVRVLDVAPPSEFVKQLLGERLLQVEWRVGDVRDREAVDSAATGRDAAVNLAGVLTPACQDDPIRGAQINVLGALHVFGAAKRLGMKKVIYASSAGVYGPTHGDYPEPTTHYGAFKLANEGSARAYWEWDQLPSIGFRPFVVYGPGREIGASAGISLACRAAARGERYTIPFTGSVGMIYVEDVAEAIFAALITDFSGAHVFNLLGETHSVDDFMAELRRQEPTSKIDATGAPLQTTSDLPADRTAELLPGLTPTTLADGIASTVNYFR